MSRIPAAYETPAVDSPALFGIFRPQLLFPPGFAATLNDDELRLVVLHELGHWRRRDLLSQALIQGACTLHWFNPLVWLAARLARQDCEFACDEFVIQRSPARETEGYGATLLKVLGVVSSSRQSMPVLGILENRAQLKKRLQLIVAYRKPSSARALAGTVLLVLLSAICLTRETRAQKPSPAQTATSNLVRLQVKANDAIFWNDESVPIGLPELRTRLQRYAGAGASTKTLIIIDPSLPHVPAGQTPPTPWQPAMFAQILDELQKAHMFEIRVTLPTGGTPVSIKEHGDGSVAGEAAMRTAFAGAVLKQLAAQTETNYQAAASQRGAALEAAKAALLADQVRRREEALNLPPEHTSGLPSAVVTITDDGSIYVNSETTPIGIPEVYARLNSIAPGGLVHIRTAVATAAHQTRQQLINGQYSRQFHFSFVVEGPPPAPDAKPPFSPLPPSEVGPDDHRTESHVIPSVVIQGQVEHPGRYDVDTRSNLLTAIDLIVKAGGLTDLADGTAVQIRHYHPNNMTVVNFANVDAVFKGKSPVLRSFLLEPGDLIIVPTRSGGLTSSRMPTRRVSIQGAVRNPGVYEVPEVKGLPLVELLTKAGGFTDIANGTDVRITHPRDTNGPAKTQHIDAVGILHGTNELKANDPSLILQPGDLVYVPQKVL